MDLRDNNSNNNVKENVKEGKGDGNGKGGRGEGKGIVGGRKSSGSDRNENNKNENNRNESNKDKEFRERTEPLLAKIAHLTTSLENKEEALQLLHQQLAEGRRNVPRGLDQSGDSERERERDNEQREWLAVHETEMVRLKVRTYVRS